MRTRAAGSGSAAAFWWTFYRDMWHKLKIIIISSAPSWKPPGHTLYSLYWRYWKRLTQGSKVNWSRSNRVEVHPPDSFLQENTNNIKGSLEMIKISWWINMQKYQHFDFMNQIVELIPFFKMRNRVILTTSTIRCSVHFHPVDFYGNVTNFLRANSLVSSFPTYKKQADQITVI